jgi:hypothetical protein
MYFGMELVKDFILVHALAALLLISTGITGVLFSLRNQPSHLWQIMLRMEYSDMIRFFSGKEKHLN